MPRKKSPKKQMKKLPIECWSFSSLMTYLRNPLAWYKRYVQKIYDIPSTPSAIVGRAGHLALEHYYSGTDKETAMRLGLEYIKLVPDFEINFGKAVSLRAKKKKRELIEKEYLQAIGFYLKRAPRHKVVGIEIKGTAIVEGLPIPVKAVSDLVVESVGNPGGLDIVDHKFVDAFSGSGAHKPHFLLQAIFNYYTVSELFGKPVHRFIVVECKKRRNSNGKSQLRKYVMEYSKASETFELFHRLIKDASDELMRTRVFLPNPSDMFEGEHSFDLYKLQLQDEEL
jgi:hypothetical protein